MDKRGLDELLVCLVISMPISGLASSQEPEPVIYGTVTNIYREPISGATVALVHTIAVDSFGLRIETTNTDENGNYGFPLLWSLGYADIPHKGQ